MHEAYWNGLFDTRWEDAPLGLEAIRLVRKLCNSGCSERTRREYGHAVVHLGRVLHAEEEDVDRVLDEEVVDDFINRRLPVCCYRRRSPCPPVTHPGTAGKISSSGSRTYESQKLM
jgi:hypothetical protein